LLGDEEELPPLSLAEIFVNLVIVNEKDQRSLEEDRLSAAETGVIKDEERCLGLLNSYEDIRKNKKPIALEDLFANEWQAQRNEIKKILLLGRAGIGKSTLCRYLAYRWSATSDKNKLLVEFDWVFHIELKRLVNDFPKEHAATKTISQILFCYYWKKQGLSESGAERLWNVILSLKKRVLFLLDGYDEVAYLQHPLVDELLRQSNYLLTSRPYAANALQSQLGSDKNAAILENIGLLPRDIEKYINNYFTIRQVDLKAMHELIEWLIEHPAVHAMCAIPIYLELLCNIWSTDRASLQTWGDIQLVNLYNLLVEKLLKRMIGRIDPSNLKGFREMDSVALCQLPDIVVAKSYLSRLAFEALNLKKGRLLISGELCIKVREELRREVAANNKGNLIVPFDYDWDFYEDDLKQKVKSPDLIQHILIKGGVLKNIGNSGDMSKNKFYFLHLSIQEYFAALFLSQNIESHEGFIREYKYDPAWQLVWSLVAGLLKDHAEKLMYFFNILLAEPRDLWGQYEVILLAQCLEACGWNDKLDERFRQRIIQYLKASFIAEVKQVEGGPIFSSMIHLPKTIRILEIKQLLVKLQLPKALGVLQTPHSKEEVSALLEGCNSEDKFVRELSHQSLATLQTPNTEVIDFLLQACKKGDSRAIKTLGYLKNPSLKVIRELLDLLEKDDKATKKILGSYNKLYPYKIIGRVEVKRIDREEIIKTLSHMRNINPDLIDFLLEKYEEEDNWSVRKGSEVVLTQLKRESDDVRLRDLYLPVTPIESFTDMAKAIQTRAAWVHEQEARENRLAELEYSMYKRAEETLQDPRLETAIIFFLEFHQVIISKRDKSLENNMAIIPLDLLFRFYLHLYNSPIYITQVENWVKEYLHHQLKNNSTAIILNTDGGFTFYTNNHRETIISKNSTQLRRVLKEFRWIPPDLPDSVAFPSEALAQSSTTAIPSQVYDNKLKASPFRRRYRYNLQHFMPRVSTGVFLEVSIAIWLSNFKTGEQHRNLYGLCVQGTSSTIGNSLFEVIAQSIPNMTPEYLRFYATDCIMKNNSLSAHIIDRQQGNSLFTKEGEKNYTTLAEYLELMKCDETCGTYIELIALSYYLGIPVVILTPNNDNDCIVNLYSSREENAIFVNYNGNNYYQRLVIPLDSSITAQQILKEVEKNKLQNNMDLVMARKRLYHRY